MSFINQLTAVSAVALALLPGFSLAALQRPGLRLRQGQGWLFQDGQ
jgi:hypothetical protein